MLINILKSGKWAFKGIWVEQLTKGLQEMKDDKAEELIENGRAVIPEAEEVVPTESEDIVCTHSENELKKEPVVVSVKKGKAGWWSVVLEGHDEVKVQGADDEAEAIILAQAKLEVK